MTERQQQRETVVNEEQQPRLSTADMAAAAKRPQREQPPATTAQIDDAVPIEPQAAAAAPPQREQPPATTAQIHDGAAPIQPQAEVPQIAPANQTASQPTSLLPTDETHTFQSRWDAIQTSFVDEPRQSVEQADGLVAEVMQRLAEIFAEERGKLEGQWSRGDDVSTEDLRIALRRYRSFFTRLLSM
jgi:hypothetical protein